MNAGPGLHAVEVAEVGPEAAEEVLAIVRAAFGGRPPLDPPSTALQETTTTVAAALADHGGLLARTGDRPVGALLLGDGPSDGPSDGPGPPTLVLRRVAVLPEAQSRGVAQALARAAEEVATARGRTTLQLTARAELPGTVRFWTALGYREVSREGTSLRLGKELPVRIDVPSADAMRSLGRDLAARVAPGDLLLLTGDLGAGKTTFTQGLGAGLGIRGDVTSPTFVLSRVHPSLTGGPALVHVDAYRLGGRLELDDLDLDVSLAGSVTVVEWGQGLAEELAEDRLELLIERSHGDAGSEQRTVTVVPVGARWVGSGVARSLA